jgi:hypothetical protein
MCDLTIHSHNNCLHYRFVIGSMTYNSIDSDTQGYIAEYREQVQKCIILQDAESIPYDLVGLYNYPEICKLHLFGCKNLDITLLTGLVKLRELSAACCELDLPGIEFCYNLTELILINVQLSGELILSSISLELLWLKNTPIESLQVINTKKLKNLRLLYSPSVIKQLRQMMPFPSLTDLGFYYYFHEDVHNAMVPNDLLEEWCADDGLRQCFSNICHMFLENPADYEEFQGLVSDLMQIPSIRASKLWIGSGYRCEMTKIVGCCQAYINRISLNES